MSYICVHTAFQFFSREKGDLGVGLKGVLAGLNVQAVGTYTYDSQLHIVNNKEKSESCHCTLLPQMV